MITPMSNIVVLTSFALVLLQLVYSGIEVNILLVATIAVDIAHSRVPLLCMGNLATIPSHNISSSLCWKYLRQTVQLIAQLVGTFRQKYICNSLRHEWDLYGGLCAGKNKSSFETLIPLSQNGQMHSSTGRVLVSQLPSRRRNPTSSMFRNGKYNHSLLSLAQKKLSEAHPPRLAWYNRE